jgi:threonine synthase
MHLVLYVESVESLDEELTKNHNIEIIEYSDTYEERAEKARQEADKHSWYNANPGMQNNILNMYGFAYIAKEINRQLSEEPDTVFCQTGNGASVSGLHLGFRELWVGEKTETIPRLYAISTAHGNAIVRSYEVRSEQMISLDPDDLIEQQSDNNRHLLHAQCFNGQDALNSLYATEGTAIGITDEELLRAAERFDGLEEITHTIPNLYPIAGLYKVATDDQLKDGVHVVVLHDGKVDLDIRILEKYELSVSFREFLNKLDDWLIQFSDPLEEIEEAVENAFHHGFVLGAYFQGMLSGIAVVSKTRFKTFFPQYHLSYIATRKGVKGRGIATELLDKVIDLAKGDLSLHVEVDNERATKLYEKMGFQKKYYRMLYQGEVI